MRSIVASILSRTLGRECRCDPRYLSPIQQLLIAVSNPVAEGAARLRPDQGLVAAEDDTAPPHPQYRHGQQPASAASSGLEDSRGRIRQQKRSGSRFKQLLEVTVQCRKRDSRSVSTSASSRINSWRICAPGCLRCRLPISAKISFEIRAAAPAQGIRPRGRSRRA